MQYKKLGEKPLRLELITAGEETQMRYATKLETVKEYAEQFSQDHAWPFDTKLIVFYDGDEYWLADGFHRFEAATMANRTSVHCIVYDGTIDDAQDYALQANASHGLRRTNEDKRKAVEVALSMDRWSSKSDRAIADHIGVGRDLVGKLRKQLSVNDSRNTEPEIRVGKDGKKRAVKPKPAATAPAPSPTPAALPPTSMSATTDEEYEDCEPPEAVENEPLWMTNRDQIDQFRKEINALIKTIKDAPQDPGFELLNQYAARIKTDLDNAKAAINGCIPFSVCPYCLGNDSDCDACNGRNWVNKTTFNNAPKEMQDEAKRLSSGGCC